MDPNDRLSATSLKLLKLLLEKPREGRSGADISRAAKITSGTLYPLLARLEGVGWLTSEWEAVDPSVVGRPRRRFYKLTATGQANALNALSEFQISCEVPAWNS
jgi:PadR family transcriptional regulator PadR